MSIASAEPTPTQTAPLTETLIAALALTAVSDRILFNAPVGLSLVVFALLTGGAALWLHRLLAGRMRLVLAACIYGLALLPLMENISPLSIAVAFSLFAVASLTLAALLDQPRHHGAAELLQDSGDAMTTQERQRFLGNIISDTARLDLLVRLMELAKAKGLSADGAVSTMGQALALLEPRLIAAISIS